MRVLVTGASRGIGRAVALALARRGDSVALVARDEAALSEVAARASAATVLAADLAADGAAERLVDRALGALGGLDAVVNCAGVARYAAASDVTRAELREQLDVNLVAPFFVTQRAALHMQRLGIAGAIVNVASTLAEKPAPYTAAYATSKAAVLAMTRAFALELGPHGIRVNAIAPGVVDTDMVRVVRPSADASLPNDEARIAAELEQLRSLHLVGRLGEPDDVADSVLYLLDAKFVTGTVLVVDGGLLLA